MLTMKDDKQMTCCFASVDDMSSIKTKKKTLGVVNL